MNERILITGGAGFVGSHLADRLISAGYKVRILDNLSEQVHPRQQWPSYLHPDIEPVHGDVCDVGTVAAALQGVDAVFHFAAAVGVGQSMYQIRHYTEVNNLGTAVLLEALVASPVKKLVVASSMSIYGEGLYQDWNGSLFNPGERSELVLKEGFWEMDNGTEILQPLPTPESKMPAPSSVYALSKYDQERLCLMIGAAYKIPTTALRFFNIYGPRQALSNPYTGVLAIFSARYLNNRPPLIFEDGYQRRDFVSVHDVAQACHLALESSNADGEVFNVGSGENYSILDIAGKLAKVLYKTDIAPEFSGEYRVGDIRHCFADISKARNLLGYQPKVGLEQGLDELATWLQTQTAEDRVENMRRELSSRGLSA